MNIGEAKGGRDAEVMTMTMTRPQFEESNVPGDRELARSSPAFMVVNWIVRTDG
jgi:hypothetical protein